MCKWCWDKYKPVEVSPLVKSVANLIKKIYAFHSAGGSLHIVLDDWNLDNSSLEFCEYLIRVNKYNESRRLINLEVECINLLRGADINTRATALALANYYIKEV